MTSLAIFYCPACGHKYIIVGDPVTEKELIAGFLVRHRRCRNCNGVMVNERINAV